MSWLSKLRARISKKKKKEEKQKEDIKPPLRERLSEGIFALGLPELTPEEEETILDEVAKKIHRYKLETPAIMFLESVKPVSFIGSQLGLVTVSPFLEVIGIKGYDYSALFSKRENVERLLKKIEALARS